MRYTKEILHNAIEAGNEELIHVISMEKSKNGNATAVARVAQEYLWSGEFCRSYYNGSWRSGHRSLSDEHEW